MGPPCTSLFHYQSLFVENYNGDVTVIGFLNGTAVPPFARCPAITVGDGSLVVERTGVLTAVVILDLGNPSGNLTQTVNWVWLPNSQPTVAAGTWTVPPLDTSEATLTPVVQFLNNVAIEVNAGDVVALQLTAPSGFIKPVNFAISPSSTLLAALTAVRSF